MPIETPEGAGKRPASLSPPPLFRAPVKIDPAPLKYQKNITT